MARRKSLFVFLCLLFFSFSKLSAEEPLGLVLCGNSVRAYSHIGVLRSLEKAGIKPDFIVADSISAMIGILYASGFSADDIETIVSSVDLNSFFRMVKPGIDGNIDSQYFNAFISELYLRRPFDIKDAAIPVIIPTEEPHTKRPIIFKDGDVKEIFKTLFSYAYMTEPVSITQDKNTIYQLEDTGKSDYRTLITAEQYSRNLIVSTALYHPVQTPKETATLITSNRSDSKNDPLIQELLITPYSWIRIDVEDLSFLDNDDRSVIIKLGEATADLYLETHPIKSTGTFDDFLSENPGFTYLRAIRKATTEKVCHEMSREMEFYQMKQKRNPDLRENAPAVELKDFFFSEQFSSGLYTFLDFRPLYIRTGIRTNFYTFWKPDEDLLPEIKTTLLSEYNPLSFADSVFAKITEQDIILGMENKIVFYIPGIFSLRPYATGELAIHFSGNITEDKKFLLRSGLEIFNNSNEILTYSLDPFAFLFSDSIPMNVGRHYGFGIKASADFLGIPFLGFKMAQSWKYQENGYGIVLNKNDGYRGICPPDKPQTNQSTYFYLSQIENFWYIRNAPVKPTETIKIEKIKAGLFVDSLSFKDATEFSAGIFLRPQIIIRDESIINLEIYAGYDSTEQSPVFGFSFTRNW